MIGEIHNYSFYVMPFFK